VNTGWVGGPYGIGKRISIRYTRELLNAALSGELLDVEYYKDPIFGFEVPTRCGDIPEDVLRHPSLGQIKTNTCRSIASLLHDS
jgi:phosphoenolpyruvate carboxykinase (ATP)